MAMAAEKRETSALIGSDKVEGTNVYRSNGDKIGSIERIMLDKQSGKVAYAVMSFGGFLGIGHDHYPVPWSLLTYNTNLGGYEVNISDQQLKGAPSYSNDNDWDWEDRKRAQQVYDYYRVPPYWMAQFLARIVMPRSFSRSLLSITRSVIAWWAAKVPDWRRSWSTRVVLP